MRTRRQLGTLVFAALVALGGAAGAAPLKVGAPAPALVARALNGDLIDLDHPPGKVLVVNLWATWCAPCRAEMPMLNAFFQHHEADGVLVVGVSADRSRDEGEVRKVMSTFAYPAALLAKAKVDELDDPRVLPVTYVVDQRGIVRATFGGAGTPLTAERLSSAVQAVLDDRDGRVTRSR